MIRVAFGFFLALLSAQVIAQDVTPMTEEEKPWFLKEEWLNKNAPYGVDVTPDTKVWIKVNHSLDGDAYSILADDYEVRDATTPKVWLRGYHKNNSKVTYRESRTLYHFDCRFDTYYSSYGQTYKADRSVLSIQSWRSATSPVIPGSLAEEWARVACRPK